MDKKNNYLMYIIFILVMMILVLVGYIFYTDNLFGVRDALSHNKKEVVEEDEEKAVYEFLTSSEFISNVQVVASDTPSGYTFLKNGYFAYLKNDDVTIEDEEKCIGYRGTWKLTNNTIVLSLQEEIIAYNIEKHETMIGDQYTYDIKNNSTNDEIRIYLADNKVFETSGGVKFITTEDSGISLYQLPEISSLTTYAKEGFNSYYKIFKDNQNLN